MKTTYSQFLYATVTHLPSDQKSCFKWSPEEEKALQWVWMDMQAALPRGPYDPTTLMMLEV